MRTTTILNLKGGVGKTTTIIHMAAILARDYTAKVLIVDCDSQHNATSFFEADAGNGSTTTVLQHGGGEYAASCIQRTAFPGVDILPGDSDLMGLDLSALKGGKVKTEVFRDMILELGRRESYDYVLFDAPPAFNAAAAAALIAADDVVIPIKLDAFSLEGMGNVIQQIQSMQQINPRLRVAGILPTMYYRSQTIEDAEKTLLGKCSYRVFHHIRRSPKVDELTFTREALAAPKAGSERDYRVFVQEYREVPRRV